MPRINVDIDASGAASGAAQVNRALASIGSQGKSLLSSVFSPLNAAIGAIGGGLAVKSLVNTADSYTVMATQLEYLTGSAAEAAEAEKALYQVSQQTGTSMEENSGTLVNLAQASEMTGLSMSENIQVVGGLNALMLKTGTSGVAASAAMYQLSQALTSGKLQGDEFRSMAENAPGVLQALATAIGVPRSELKQMSADGQLTSEILGKAFLDISESAEGSFEGIPETAQSGWQQVVNAFKEAWDQINDDTGIMGMLRRALIDLARWIEEKTPAISAWFTDMVEKAKAAWPELKATFNELMGQISLLWQNVSQSLPSMETFFTNLTGVVNATIAAIKIAIELFNKFKQGAGGIMAGAKSYVQGDSLSTVAAKTREGFDPGFKDYYSDVDKGVPAAQNAAGGSTVNINVNQAVSRSDVVNIANEMTRVDSRL